MVEPLFDLGAQDGAEQLLAVAHIYDFDGGWRGGVDALREFEQVIAPLLREKIALDAWGGAAQDDGRPGERGASERDLARVIAGSGIVLLISTLVLLVNDDEL
jgi:hypothetical protein